MFALKDLSILICSAWKLSFSIHFDSFRSTSTRDLYKRLLRKLWSQGRTCTADITEAIKLLQLFRFSLLLRAKPEKVLSTAWRGKAPHQAEDAGGEISRVWDSSMNLEKKIPVQQSFEPRLRVYTIRIVDHANIYRRTHSIHKTVATTKATKIFGNNKRETQANA